MRYIFILLLILNCSYAQPVKFIEGVAFDNLLRNNNDRLFFLDFFTTWCGPCKRMDKEVFVDSGISKLLNSDFISLKINAEEGEGISLAKKYNVTTYPTYLFLNSKGVLIYRSIGYMPAHEFSGQIKNALAESKELMTVITLDSLYKYNYTNKDFVRDYLIRRTKLRLDNSDILDHYVNTLSSDEQSKEETLRIIIDNGSKFNKSLQIGPALKVLIDNENGLLSLKSTFPLKHYVENAKRKTLTKAIEFRSDSLLNLCLNLADNKDVFDNSYTVRLEYLSGVGDVRKFFQVANEFVNTRLSEYTLKRMVYLDSVALAEIMSDDEFKTASTSELNEVKSDYKHTQSIRFVRLYNNSIIDFLVANDNINSHFVQVEKWAREAVKICAFDKSYFKYVYPHSLNNLAKVLYRLNKKSEAIYYQSLAVSSSSALDDDENLEEYKQQLLLMKKNKLLK